ncbi:MAG: HAMP domain-containing histidine kinase [Lewinellaceae bacterium]|nr:HAMP domain-containing histidine kinase [Lewinellaceae bacterium]
MKNSTILRVMILGAIAIIGIIGVQAYWVVSTWNINEEEFDKKINLALYEVACSLVELNNGELPPRNIVNRRTSNYYVVNIESEIDANSLEYFLQKEFERLALYVDFEYAVYDCTTNEMVYGNYCSYSPGKKKDLELGNLPKDDKFTYYFSVKFPTRSSYLFGQMQLSIFFSAILLVVILFFAYSMFVILRQKRLSELQKDFINNMTHEFKTPISTIKIAADVFLANPVVQEDQRLLRYASIVREQNQRLNNQVEKVLQLAKIERGNFELKQEHIPLREVLQSIVESTAVKAERQGGTLNSRIDVGEATVLADRLHLTNILHNLMDNAIKYCKDAPRLTLRARARDGEIRITIADDGIGIPREHLSKVFNKFYRIPTGNVHKVKGFGLGLYYVKSICDAHGWRIRLDSQEGKGTCVHLVIPEARQTAWAHWHRWWQSTQVRFRRFTARA